MSYIGLNTISTFQNTVLDETMFKAFLIDYLDGQFSSLEDNSLIHIYDEHNTSVTRIRSTNLMFVYKRIIELVPESVKHFRYHILNRIDSILNNNDETALLCIEDEMFHFDQYFERN